MKFPLKTCLYTFTLEQLLAKNTFIYYYFLGKIIEIKRCVMSTRTEEDLLGFRDVDENAYYGVQTLRAKENFHITGIPISHFPEFIKSFAQVKKATALANNELGLLDNKKKEAICKACDEIIEGKHIEHFVVDVIQGGAGTSTNMNMNEVIANRALELLGYNRGEYDYLHPNNDVNKSQSTNDSYPTSIRMTLYEMIFKLIDAMEILRDSFLEKSKEFESVLKMGRTQLQDAVPMTVGQEFHAFATAVSDDINILKETQKLFLNINLGATAIGTGINTNPQFSKVVDKHLSEITGRKYNVAKDLIEATSDTGDYVQLSGVLKRTAVKVSKICNDLRLLSSGPRAGLKEINLPAVQPGSSIMPGKVNPVIPEVVNQVCFQVIGLDATISIAAEAGQLQLNVFEPVIAFDLFSSITMMERAFLTLVEKSIKGITVNEDRCKDYVLNSIGLVTALNPYIGYENSSSVAKEALKTGRSVYDIVLERKLLSKEKLDKILKPENMVKPHIMIE